MASFQRRASYWRPLVQLVFHVGEYNVVHEEITVTRSAAEGPLRPPPGVKRGPLAILRRVLLESPDSVTVGQDVKYSRGLLF